MDAGKFKSFDPVATLRRPDAAATAAAAARFDAVAALAAQATGTRVDPAALAAQVAGGRLDPATLAALASSTRLDPAVVAALVSGARLDPAALAALASGTRLDPAVLAALASGTRLDAAALAALSSGARPDGTALAGQTFPGLTPGELAAAATPTLAGTLADLAPTRPGLLVSLSARALDTAAAGRSPLEMGMPDYSHLRPGLPRPAAAARATPAPVREQPFAGMPGMRDAGEGGLRVATQPAERDSGPSATTLLPPRGDGRDEGGLRQAPGSPQAEAFAPMLHAAAGAALPQRIAPTAQPEDLQPRAVPEMMAQFFARPEAQPQTRWSLGKLLLAAAALGVVLLLVL